MTFLEISLSITTILFIATTVWACRTLYKLGLSILRVEDTLEQSLLIMDDRIDEMEKILSVPLFSDSPEIKRIHTSMQSCRDSLLSITTSLTEDMSEEKPEQQEEK